MDYATNVVRINALARKLQKKTADSFADKKEVYLLATDIMMEANEIRRAANNERGRFANNLWDRLVNLLGFGRFR